MPAVNTILKTNPSATMSTASSLGEPGRLSGENAQLRSALYQRAQLPVSDGPHLGATQQQPTLLILDNADGVLGNAEATEHLFLCLNELLLHSPAAAEGQSAKAGKSDASQQSGSSSRSSKKGTSHVKAILISATALDASRVQSLQSLGTRGGDNMIGDSGARSAVHGAAGEGGVGRGYDGIAVLQYTAFPVKALSQQAACAVVTHLLGGSSIASRSSQHRAHSTIHSTLHSTRNWWLVHVGASRSRWS